MKVLIDECAPRALKLFLAKQNHECLTVQEAGWSGKRNGELLTLAEASYQVFGSSLIYFFMKRLLLPIILLAVIVPINGQEKRIRSQSGKSRTEELQKVTTQPPSTNSVVSQQAANQEQNGSKNNSQSYLHRLLAPENLPNIALFLVGAVGICVAIRTLRAMERQAAIMRGQLTVPYRAYLGLIEPEKPINDRIQNVNCARFPIENTGHVRAAITLIEAEVIIQDRSGRELFRRSSIKEIDSKDGEIPPEKTSSYAVTVSWPSDIPNVEDTVVQVRITYKRGFKGVHLGIFSFVRVFNTRLQDWTRAYHGVDIDLAKAQEHKEELID